MLTPEAFEQVRREICVSGPPSGGDDLLGMEIDLPTSEKVRTRRVSQSYGARFPCRGMTLDRGLFRLSGHGALGDAQAIATALSRIWMENLRYTYREGHTVLQTSNDVRLRAVSQIDPHDFWVTAEVRVLLS